MGIYLGDALDMYPHWPNPVVIVSDGAYGVSGFPGDTPTIGLMELDRFAEDVSRTWKADDHDYDHVMDILCQLVKCLR